MVSCVVDGRLTSDIMIVLSMPLLLLMMLLCGVGVNSQPLPMFASPNPWTDDISASAIDSNSANMVQFLLNQGGIGFGSTRVHFDLGIHVLTCDCNCVKVPHVAKSGGYFSPDCDPSSLMVPLPAMGALEGANSWTSSIGCSGDCHLIVYDTSTNILYESWDTNIIAVDAQGFPTSFESTGMIQFNTSHVYPKTLRGVGCTSADAAGFPISTLLATPEEIQSGSIDHALRFILPNARMKALAYREPATHYGGPTSVDANSIPYGSRIRLKSTYDCAGFANAYQVICAALKKYGAYLSDGGNIPFTLASDQFRTLKWSTVGFTDTTPYDSAMSISDFDFMPPYGPAPNDYTFASRPNCVRNTIPLDLAFDGCSTSVPTVAPSNAPTTQSPTVTPGQPTKAPTTKVPSSAAPTNSMTPTTQSGVNTMSPTPSSASVSQAVSLSIVTLCFLL